MLDEKNLKKIKKAEQLRKKPNWFAALFVVPDYFESGTLFEEVADSVPGPEEKEKWLMEAATTFEMEKGEFGAYKAYEMYSKIGNIYDEIKNKIKASDYWAMAGNQLVKCGKHFLAGQFFYKAGLAIQNASYKKTTKLFESAVQAYTADGKSPFHIKVVLESMLTLQLQFRDAAGAFSTFSKLNVKYSALCRHILGIIIGEDPQTELDSEAENDLYLSMINKDGIKAFEEFEDENTLPEYLINVFNLYKEKMNPDSNIC